LRCGVVRVVSDGAVAGRADPNFLHVSGTSPAATDSPRSTRVNAPHALAPRPPALVDADEQTGLTALLELFSAEEPAARAAEPAAPRPRPTVRESVVRLLAWTRASSQRAAAWGSGPQGAWRAW
jgi:hypothetical protein